MLPLYECFTNRAKQHADLFCFGSGTQNNYLCTLALFFEINKTADASLSKNVLFLIGAERGFLQCFCQKVIFATEVFVSI